MNLLQRKNLYKLILIGVVLFLVQLSCGVMPATDPSIPVSLNNMVFLFHPLLSGLGVIPTNTNQPPLITQIQPSSVSGLGVNGSSPTKILLYRMKLQGCGNEPVRGELLAETTVNTDGIWTITDNLNPKDVVGATQVSEGKESGMSNLGVNIDQSQLIILDDKDQIQQTGHETFQPLSLAGTSISGACVVLQNHDPQYGRIGSASADASGGWKISVQLQDGENKLKLFVDGLEANGVEFSILGFTPVMQWPYTEKKENGDYVAPLNAWFGNNDYHLKDLHMFHDGIDIGGKAGTLVHAVADGSVFYIQIGKKIGDCGNVVFIDHGAWFSVYCHLDSITINGVTTPSASKYYDQPISVAAGDIIGKTGCTGLSTCQNHLHLSALKWDKGNRQESLGSTRTLVWPWEFGEVMNINPPGNMTLGNGENSSDRIQNCVSDFNYWSVDWSKISIGEFGYPSGTKFTVMGNNVKCAIKGH